MIIPRCWLYACSYTVSKENACVATQIRVAIYNQGVQKAYVTFNAVGADKMSWFDPSRIIDSSWGDIKSIPKNFFQMAG